MSSRFGNSFSITVNLNGRMFHEASVTDMTMIFPMNEMPYGSFKLQVAELPDYKVESGSFGTFVFLHTGDSEIDGSGFSFYVDKASESIQNEQTVNIDIIWHAGNEATMANKTMANTGSSLDTMIEIIKSYEGQVVYKNLITGDAANLTDSMTWRFINADMVDMLTDTVNHSSMVGDYMFWTFDETKQAIVISSLNTAKRVGTAQGCIFSYGAGTSTNASMFSDSNTGSRLWLYAMEERSDNRGELIEKAFPKIVFSNVTAKGEADVTNCGGDCLDKVMQNYGAMSNKDAAEKFGLKDDKVTFGPTIMVDSFPGNVHTSYVIAEQVRERILAEYSKILTIGLYNTLGPTVGSRVYVRTLKPTRNGGNVGTDMQYTDTYIVASKKLVRNSTNTEGVLGVPSSSENTDYVTVLVLISNSMDESGYKPTMEALDNIAKACKVEQEKK